MWLLQGSEASRRGFESRRRVDEILATTPIGVSVCSCTHIAASLLLKGFLIPVRTVESPNDLPLSLVVTEGVADLPIFQPCRYCSLGSTKFGGADRTSRSRLRTLWASPEEEKIPTYSVIMQPLTPLQALKTLCYYAGRKTTLVDACLV